MTTDDMNDSTMIDGMQGNKNDMTVENEKELMPESGNTEHQNESEENGNDTKKKNETNDSENSMSQGMTASSSNDTCRTTPNDHESTVSMLQIGDNLNLDSFEIHVNIDHDGKDNQLSETQTQTL